MCIHTCQQQQKHWKSGNKLKEQTQQPIDEETCTYIRLYVCMYLYELYGSIFFNFWLKFYLHSDENMNGGDQSVCVFVFLQQQSVSDTLSNTHNYTSPGGGNS